MSTKINDNLTIHYPLNLKPRKEQLDMLKFTADSINNEKKFVLLNAPTGIGKAQPLTSKILTPSGWKTIGDINEGDEIVTPSGKISKIIKLHEINNLSTYKITFCDGRTAECTENHLWKAFNNDWTDRDGRWRIVDTKYLKEKHEKTKQVQIPLISQNINQKDIELPINPYLLGCLLGDGCLRQTVTFTSGDDFMINKLNSILDCIDMKMSKQKNKFQYGVISKSKKFKFNKLKIKLQNLNIHGLKSEDKFIPDIYLNSSFNQKVQLIHGLMDTDGYITPTGSASFSSSSIKLIQGLQEIIWSIGGIAEIKEKKSNYKYLYEKNIKKHYQLNIRISTPEILFSLPRKLERVPKDYQYSDLKLRIDNIEEINKIVPTRCITIDDPEQLYITDNYVVTHNSYFVVMFINYYINNINSNAKFDILTNSKILQDQYLKDYPFIKNLKGKSNYPCDFYDTNCEEGMELCRILKHKCDECPYKTAKKEWMTSQISLTNFHLFDSLALYVPADLEDRGARVLIIDEAHGFENVFCDYISVKLSARWFKKYGFDQTEIEKWDQQIARIKKLDQYVNFIEFNFIPRLVEHKAFLEDEVGSHTISKKRRLEVLQYKTYTDSQITKFGNFLTDYKRDPADTDEGINPKDNWVLDVEKNPKEKHYSGIELTCQPVWAYPYLKQKVFEKYDHVIMMSGTILDRKMFSFINGLDVDLTTYYDIPSPFDKKSRPIYYIKTGKMTWDHKVETFKTQKEMIKKILNKHKNQKGIIHATTYEFAEWIKNEIYNDRLLFHDTKNREDILNKHLTSQEHTVLVSPSMEEGISLDGELGRFQIIMKMPYPNISSNKIKQRQKTNNKWYSWTTCCTLIQMAGRSIRSNEDWADTYILDSSFSDLLKYNGDNMPRWFTDAIKELKT